MASESTWLYRDAEVVNRRLKPLERPQVRFDVEHAILHGDSVWVVVRATIPHRSIRRGECFKAISVLQASEGIMELGELSLDSGHFMPDEDGDVAVTTRPGRMQNLYLSWRFAWDERMRMNTFIVVFASLTDGRHLFQYLPLMLPLFWIDDTEDEFYWPRSAEIPEEALLDRSPFETAVE
nr:hypothetical protein [uncultured Alistipes sp.]